MTNQWQGLLTINQ